MTLWILERRNLNRRKAFYDAAHGFVVRANTEADARRLASEQAGDEGREEWIDYRRSTCLKLDAEGEPEVILRDFIDA